MEHEVDVQTLSSKSKEDLIKIILEQRKILDNKKEFPEVDGRTLKRARTKSNTKTREIEWNKYSTRHVAFQILYIGWDYHGLASPDGHKVETMEMAATIEVQVIFWWKLSSVGSFFCGTKTYKAHSQRV
eukprot:TRINITY_DN25164_c0_g1_i1.p1 TRINITY_DN25164_c0_g1~~TRINITY_DN25164_c0_g1_i1.p1  ORF type:complete len:141 (-),score=29.29 TRINITY_DN25164_c0_g1_i1:404-790(-)